MPVFRTVAILTLLLALACMLPFAVAYAGGWNFERGEVAESAAVMSAVFALIGGIVIAVIAFAKIADNELNPELRHARSMTSRGIQKDATIPKLHPTAQQINSACLSYDHAFGLMSKDEQERMRFQATEWLRAWQKEGAWQWRK